VVGGSRMMARADRAGKQARADGEASRAVLPPRAAAATCRWNVERIRRPRTRGTRAAGAGVEGGHAAAGVAPVAALADPALFFFYAAFFYLLLSHVFSDFCDDFFLNAFILY